jgi:anti-sigma regulatory factor (Ser/Thr protein kinase)
LVLELCWQEAQVPISEGEGVIARVDSALSRLGEVFRGTGLQTPSFSRGSRREDSREQSLTAQLERRRCRPLRARHPCSPASARRFVEDLGQKLQLGEERTFDLKMAVSEACANAIVHGEATEEDLEVSAWAEPQRLTVGIVSKGGFRLHTGCDGCESLGMGMRLMAALTDEVTVRRLPQGGTAVFLTLLRRCS